jgi:hypothetical protein
MANTAAMLFMTVFGKIMGESPARAAPEKAVEEFRAGPEVAVLAPHGETEPRAALDPCVLGGEAAGGHGHPADAREPAYGIGVEEGHEFVVVDLGGETARAIRNGECLERRDGLRGSLEDGGHRGGAAAAGGAHRAQAGDHDPAAGPHRPNTRLTFCPPKPKELDTAAPSSTDRPCPGDAIEGHVRIRIAQARGGRDEAVLQGEESGRRLHAARGRHGVADQRLGRAHEHATFPEDADEGERLDAIVLRGARAVGVDVADVGGRAPGTRRARRPWRESFPRRPDGAR